MFIRPSAPHADDPREAVKHDSTAMIRDLIFDVGFHQGQDTAYYLAKGFRVVAVEANPHLVTAAHARFADAIASHRLTLLNVAIAAVEGEASFFVCESNTAWSSFDVMMASRQGASYNEISVRTMPLAQLLAAHGTPFFMKIDIEGSDALCLADLRSDDLPAFISCEIDGPDIIDRLSEVGFSGFKVIDQYSHCALASPPTGIYRAFSAYQRVLRSQKIAFRIFRKLGGEMLVNALEARHRDKAGWHFEFGSSGPFGDDTPGAWLSAEEAKANYRRHATLTRTREYRMDVWCDVHACLAPAP